MRGYGGAAESGRVRSVAANSGDMRQGEAIPGETVAGNGDRE